MKPSWLVTRLRLACGLRAERSNRSAEPSRRPASSGRIASSPRQKRRTVSRKRSFHSRRLRKAAQPVAVGAEVPGLGDQLQPAQHRVLRDRLQERGIGVEPVLPVAAERGAEIEAEAVDA